MGSSDLLVMMLALPPVGLAGCLRWYVTRASRELDNFIAVLPGLSAETSGQSRSTDAWRAHR